MPSKYKIDLFVVILYQIRNYT